MEYCLSQVKEDCEELLSRFQATQSVRFEAFSQIWRDMQFEQILYGLELHERRPFCRLVLDVASQFFLPPFTFNIRVGGLYLLYALVHQQPTEPPEQIRLPLMHWKEVQQFEEDSLNAHHFDVVMILRRLLAEKLLNFTAMPTLLCYRKKRGSTAPDTSKDFLERTSRPLDLINPELLEEVANVHDVYEKLKSSVRGLSQDSGSNISRTDLVPRLQAAVMQFAHWQQRNMEQVGPPVGSTEEQSSSAEQESSRRAQLLSNIKTKAFQTPLQASKSRRHRQVQLDSQPTDSSRKSRSTRLSLKARTIMNVRLTGDLEKETSTTTRVNRLSTLDTELKGTPKPPTRFSW